MRHRLSGPVVCLALLALVCPPATARDARSDPRTSVTGVVTVLQVDDFSGGSRVEHVLDDAAGRRFRLDLSELHRARLATGDRVRARGTLTGEELRVDAEPQSIEVLEAASPAVAGERDVVVFVLEFQDETVSCTDGSIADALWDGEQSVDGLYRENSSGQLSFPGDADSNGQPDVFRVALSANASGNCDPDPWAAAADQAAALAGIDLSPYEHRLYVLPSSAGCSWAGLASVGCWGPCRAWVKTCWLPDVFAHELGHNLGMRHASTDENNDGAVDCEYCDLSDVMGLGGVGWRHFNGPHKKQMGWLSEGQPASGDSGGTLVVSSLEQDPGEAPFPQLYEVSVAGASPYTLSFRRQARYDAGLLDSYARRTNIHRQAGTAGNTLLVALLEDGETFEDTVAGVTVTQVSHDAATATVLVSTACEWSNPEVTVDPETVSAMRNVERTFTVDVTNRDSETCGPTAFTLGTDVPGGWSVTAHTSTFELDPAETTTVTVRVTPTSAAPGSYPIEFDVEGGGATGHAATASATFVVEASPLPPVEGLEGWSRASQVALQWSPPSGAAGLVDVYRVYRGGEQIGETVDGFWVDRDAESETTYTYHVTAVEAESGEGSAGDGIEIETGSLPNRRDGDRAARLRSPRAR